MYTLCTMYLQCLLPIFFSINWCNGTWISISGPKPRNSPELVAAENKDPKLTALALSASKRLPEPANAIDLDLNPALDEKTYQENAPSGETDPPVGACCGDQPATTETDCCGYNTTDKQIERSLNTIVHMTNEGDILEQIYSLVNDVSVSTQKVVDNLTFAVFVPEMGVKKEADVVWQFAEQVGTDEIDIKLHHDAVNYMVSTDIMFKLAILKYNGGQSFDTVSPDGHNFIHGPFIMVQTTSEDEISPATSVLEFKINKEQLKHRNAKWSCVFWNTQTYMWETRGLKTVDDERYIICQSNHLSAFSVLMDPFPELGFNDNNNTFLTILSVLGALVSIPCLIFTIILYRRNRVRREKISSRILVNCCFSLILFHIFFILFTFTSEILPCWVLNFFIHYSGSSTLLWTAADGINMWRKLFADIFDKRKTVFYRWSKIISWGFPFITSFAGVLITDYSKQCRISFKYNILLYAMPCALVMLTNVIFFTIMFLNVVYKDKIKSLHGKKKKYVMSLVQVFGLCWWISFCFLWIKETRILGHVAFTFFVSTQGVIIFFVRCVSEKEIRGELIRYTVFRKVFRRVLHISDDKLYKNGKGELTGIFALSSITGSGKSFVSSSETFCT